jgi:hypothetical protein
MEDAVVGADYDSILDVHHEDQSFTSVTLQVLDTEVIQIHVLLVLQDLHVVVGVVHPYRGLERPTDHREYGRCLLNMKVTLLV